MLSEPFCWLLKELESCGQAENFYFLCTTWAADGRIADALAESEWSRVSVRHDVICVGNEISMQKGLVLTMRESAKSVEEASGGWRFY